MDNNYISGKFINELELILASHGLDSTLVSDIKLDASEVLDEILIEHGIFEDFE